MLNFPNAPSAGQKYTPGGAAPSYLFDGVKWTIYGNATRAPASNANPAMDGTASAGSSASYARGDHVHPTDTTRAPINSAAFTGTLTAQMLSLTGNLTVNGKFISSTKQNRFGVHGGVGATGAVTQADANILFYDGGGGNWCGFGADSGGQVWLRSGTTGSPVPSFYVGNDQVVHFTNSPTIPTMGAGDNSTQLANTAFVKARAGAGNYYPLDSSKTITGNVTLANADLWIHQNNDYGVLYLGNTGSYYLQWDGSNYNMPTGHVYASQGRLYGTNDFGGAMPWNNVRLAYVTDQNLSYADGLHEDYAGSVMTGSSGDQGGPGYGWLRRFRQMQYYTNGWFAIGYA